MTNLPISFHTEAGDVWAHKEAVQYRLSTESVRLLCKALDSVARDMGSVKTNPEPPEITLQRLEMAAHMGEMLEEDAKVEERRWGL